MGAPLGNQNSSKANRLWAETIRRAVVQADPEKLRRIADKLLAMAEDGDIQAIKEVGDRLDGKPNQTVDATVKGDLAGILSAIPTRDDPPLEA
jgi:hypothetical protein